jgi:peptide/nickel transport system substrate-binding protein
MTRKPFDDIRVRRALGYATNRDEFIAFLGARLAIPLYAHSPQYVFGALQDKDIPKNLRLDYNPEKAKDLLKEAGYPNGFKIKVFITEKSTYMGSMTLLQEQWRRVGVNVQLQTVDHPTFHSNIRKDMNPVVVYHACRAPVAGVYLEQWYHSASVVGKKTAVTNFSHYGDVDADGDGQVDDNTIDPFVDKASVVMDPSVRKKLYQEAQMRLLNDRPAHPLVVVSDAMARQRYVDLGYEPKGSMIYQYHITEKTRILKH